MIVAVEKKVPFWEEMGDRAWGRNGRTLGRNGRALGRKGRTWEEKGDRILGRKWRSYFSIAPKSLRVKNYHSASKIVRASLVDIRINMGTRSLISGSMSRFP